MHNYMPFLMTKNGSVAMGLVNFIKCLVPNQKNLSIFASRLNEGVHFKWSFLRHCEEERRSKPALDTFWIASGFVLAMTSCDYLKCTQQVK